MRNNDNQKRLLGSWIISLLMLLGGCDNQNSDAPSRSSETASEKGSGISDEKQKSWIDVHDDIEPDLWLMERNPSDHLDRKLVQKTLSQAADRFGENPRMIANHAVQLETMLAELGKRESAISIISGLSRAVGNSNNTPGFGTIGSYYVNLRQSGYDKAGALSFLSTRYRIQQQ